MTVPTFHVPDGRVQLHRIHALPDILRIHHSGQYIPPFHDISAIPPSRQLPKTTELHGSVSVRRWTENKIPSLTYLVPPVIHLDIVSVRCQCFIRRTDDLIHILQLFQTVCAPSYDSRCCKYRCIQCLWQIQHLIYQTTLALTPLYILRRSPITSGASLSTFEYNEYSFS